MCVRVDATGVGRRRRAGASLRAQVPSRPTILSLSKGRGLQFAQGLAAPPQGPRQLWPHGAVHMCLSRVHVHLRYQPTRAYTQAVRPLTLLPRRPTLHTVHPCPNPATLPTRHSPLSLVPLRHFQGGRSSSCFRPLSSANVGLTASASTTPCLPSTP